ncbi:hypothetical protein [Siminovitchia sp. FSL W7-1587]
MNLSYKELFNKWEAFMGDMLHLLLRRDYVCREKIYFPWLG